MLSSLYACEPMSVGIYVHYVNKKNWLKNFSYRKKKINILWQDVCCSNRKETELIWFVYWRVYVVYITYYNILSECFFLFENRFVENPFSGGKLYIFYGNAYA